VVRAKAKRANVLRTTPETKFETILQEPLSSRSALAETVFWMIPHVEREKKSRVSCCNCSSHPLFPFSTAREKKRRKKEGKDYFAKSLVNSFLSSFLFLILALRFLTFFSVSGKSDEGIRFVLKWKFKIQKFNFSVDC